MVSILFGRYQYCWKVSILSGWFQYCPDGFNTVRTVSILSRLFQYCLDGFNTIRTANSRFYIAFCISGTQFISTLMMNIAYRCVSHYLLHHKRDDNALFVCRERRLCALYMSRERITLFFDVSRKRGSACFVWKKIARKKPLSGKF